MGNREKGKRDEVCLRAEAWITACRISPVWATGTVACGTVIGFAGTGDAVARAAVLEAGSTISTRGAAAEGWHCQ